MAKNEVADVPREPKPAITISETTYSKVKDLSIDDDIQIVATGRVLEIGSNERYKSPKEAVKYTAEIQLDDIRVTEAGGNSRKRAAEVAKILNIKK